MFKRNLWATDFSPHAEITKKVAVDLAKGGEDKHLWALTVLEPVEDSLWSAEEPAGVSEKNQRIDLESSAEQEIAEKYEMRASPGILVDGVSYNPLDVLLKPDCRVGEGAVRTLFTPSERANVDENER